MRVEMKHNRHSEGLLKEPTAGTRPILQDAFRKGRTPMVVTWTLSPLALEASKTVLSPRIRRWWHKGMGLGERRLQGGKWRQRRHCRLPGRHRTELSSRAPCIQRHRPHEGEKRRATNRKAVDPGRSRADLDTGGSDLPRWAVGSPKEVGVGDGGADGRRPTLASRTLRQVTGSRGRASQQRCTKH
jgi:hypothetical protein